MFLNLQSRVAENSTFLLLGDRYLRITFKEAGSLPLDDVSSIPRLKGKAAEAASITHPLADRAARRACSPAAGWSRL